LEEAAAHPAVLFPVFTNGTLIDEAALKLLDQHRNLVPVISVEGDREQTDARRGAGIHRKTMDAMQKLTERKLLFGVSVTVTGENLKTVTGGAFIGDLRRRGSRAVVFVEYVPVESPGLALSEAERTVLSDRVAEIRAEGKEIVLSFPGDEKEAGGCLAAGRGFFHINAALGAEPCPFAPVSDRSLKDITLREALKSPLFTALRENGALLEHTGGCALFGKLELLESLKIAQ
jgi:MoaA/NifB/PqqE/SkfB family radical SAM enzyme